MNETINSCLTPDPPTMAIVVFSILMLLAIYGVLSLWLQLDKFFELRRLNRINKEIDNLIDEIKSEGTVKYVKNSGPSFYDHTAPFGDSYRHRHIELLSIISSRIYAGKDISMDKAIEAGYDLINKSERFIMEKNRLSDDVIDKLKSSLSPGGEE